MPLQNALLSNTTAGRGEMTIAELNCRGANWRNLVTCPNCGENNPENFRFCGMCGTALEARRPAGAPRVAAPPDAVRTVPSASAEPQRTAISRNVPAQGSAPPVAGPSFLGLNQPPATKRQDGFDSAADGLGNKPFASVDSFFEPEEPKTGARRIFLLLVLLVVLGVAGWWVYSQYLGASTHRALQSVESAPSASEVPAANSATQPGASSGAPSSASSQMPQPSQTSQTSQASQTPSQESQPSTALQTRAASVPNSSQPAAPVGTPPTASENASSPSGKKATSAHGEVADQESSSADRSTSSGTQTAKEIAKETPPTRPEKTAGDNTKAAAPAPGAVSASTDRGDEAFRRGEAYLYGRGVRENCAEAIKSLKAAAAQRSAKARSTFGTMYATGHCVPRDLPTSYSWFAQALRLDPNNQILEKDLTAVWNQMTPPERQMATKMKE